jgi:hypothetical protein
MAETWIPLTYHAHILEFVGESYRVRERMTREQKEGYG